MVDVLTTAATVMCAHGGRVALSSVQHTLSVDGKPVLLASDLVGASISNCATLLSTANSTAPCLHVLSVLAGSSTNLSVGGSPVLLESARGITDGVAGGPGSWSVQSAGQTKLEAS
jgi:hypothetical protein